MPLAAERRYFHGHTVDGTFLLKTGPGWLYRLAVGDAGGTAANHLTFYDGVDTSGPIMFSLSLDKTKGNPLGTYELGIPFTAGLTVVSDNSDCEWTIVYE